MLSLSVDLHAPALFNKYCSCYIRYEEDEEEAESRDEAREIKIVAWHNGWCWTVLGTKADPRMRPSSSDIARKNLLL